jgi:hypothetical protein
MTNDAKLVQKPSEGVLLSRATIESLARLEPTPNAQQRRGLARGVASLLLSKAALIEASHRRRHSGPNCGETPLLNDRINETSGDQVFRRGGQLEMSRFEFLRMIAYIHERDRGPFKTRAAAAQELKRYIAWLSEDNEKLQTFPPLLRST